MATLNKILRITSRIPKKHVLHRPLSTTTLKSIRFIHNYPKSLNKLSSKSPLISSSTISQITSKHCFSTTTPNAPNTPPTLPTVASPPRNSLNTEDINEFNQLLNLFIPKFEEFITSSNDKDTPLINYALPDEINSKLLPINNNGYNFMDISNQIDLIFNYSVHNNKSTFMDKMHSGSDSIGQLSSLLLSVINANAMVYAAAPSLICIENYMIDYMCNIFFNHNHNNNNTKSTNNNGGVFTPDGSSANTLAIKLARDKYFPNVAVQGLYGFNGQIPLILSNEQVHLSTMMAANSLGIGTDNVIKIASNYDGTININACYDMLHNIQKDPNKSNYKPFFLNTLAGTNVYGAFEDFNALYQISKEFNLWFHVDAAWGGAAAFLRGKDKDNDQFNGLDGDREENMEIVDDCERIMNGSELANSIVFDAHKFMSIPYYCSMLLVDNDEYLYKSCLKPQTNYQFHNSGKNSTNYSKKYDISMKTLQCARVADAIKIYFNLLYYGKLGFENRLLNGMKNSKYLQQKINESDDFILVNDPAHFVNVCFYYIPKKYKNEMYQWKKNEFKTNINDIDNGELYKLLDSIPNKINLELRKDKDASSLLDYSGNIAQNLPSMFRGITANHRMRKESIDVILNDIRNAANKLDL